MSEDIRVIDFSTWKFVKKIKESEVVDMRWFVPTGAIMYFLTFLFYILLASSFDSGRLHDLSWTIFGIHVFVGILVVRDSLVYAGSSVFLQSLIIGLGSFNTFSLAGIVGAVMAGNMKDESFSFSVISLLLACLSNALMVALLFAMFHKTGEKINN